MIFLPLTDENTWAWFQSRTKVLRCEDTQGIVAYNDKREIQAVVVFDSFTRGNGCNVHWAIENPLVFKHGLLEEIAGHLFLTCGLRRLFALVPANNTKSVRLCEHVGLTEVTRIPNGIAEGVDYVIMLMERDDCRWLQKRLEAA